jgi:hypothetical protein
MTGIILVAPQAVGGVPVALGTSQHPPFVLARAPSSSTALSARSTLRFSPPYRRDSNNPFLASQGDDISTEICFLFSFTFFFFDF